MKFARQTGHNPRVSEYKQRIDDLASLMREFHLEEASLEVGEFRVSFRRTRKVVATAPTVTEPAGQDTDWAASSIPEVVEVPKGVPVTSPMNGIYYAASSPSVAPFVKVGDSVTAGQIIALIEAMKVFNEVPSPVSGTVLEMVAQPGTVVMPGDVLLRIG